MKIEFVNSVLRKANPEAITYVHVRKTEAGYIANFTRRNKEMRKYRVRKASLRRLIEVANSDNWYIKLDEDGKGWVVFPAIEYWRSIGHLIERRCEKAWRQQRRAEGVNYDDSI